MYKILKILFIFVLVCFFSCKTTEPASVPAVAPKVESAFQLNKINWIVDQIDPTFWAKELNMQNKMFISFSFEYSGQFNLGMLQSLVIDAPKDYYIIEDEDLQKMLEVEKNVIYCKRLPCGYGEGKVGLGEWIINVTLKSGQKIVKKLQIEGFQNLDVAGRAATKYIVPQAKFQNEISALSIPKIKSVSKDEDSIEIFFSVNDSRVKNGYFWFDVPGEKNYRDAGSVIDGKGNPVNGCRKFSVDGAECRFILRRDAENKEWFDKATALCFVVSDVNRVTDPWNERVRSISSFIKIE